MNSSVQNFHCNYIRINPNISNKVGKEFDKFVKIKKVPPNLDGTFDTVGGDG